MAMTNPIAMIEATCLWCGQPFELRRGGSPRRFCCSAHRTAFHSAARRWAERAIAAGTLTVSNLRNSATEAYTLPTARVAPAAAPKAGEADDAILDRALKRLDSRSSDELVARGFLQA